MQTRLIHRIPTLHNGRSFQVAGKLVQADTSLPSRQTGTVLIVSLIILLLLSIIGVSAMNTVVLEERMAGNLRDSSLAFQAAEAALRDGESWLSPLVIRPDECTSTPCDVWQNGALRGFEDQSAIWWANTGKDYGGSGSNNDLPGVYEDPEYILEYQIFVRDSLVVGHDGPVTGSDYYFVHSRAVGGSKESISVLQSTFAKRFN